MTSTSEKSTDSPTPPGPENTRFEKDSLTQSSLPKSNNTPLPAGIAAPVKENPNTILFVTVNIKPLA